MASREPADRRLRLLVGLVVVLGAGSVAIALLGATSGAIPNLWAVAALALLVGVGDRFSVRVRIRSNYLGIAWIDAAVVVGLALVSPYWVVLATALGMVASKSIRRVPPMRVAFGVAKEATVALVGAGVVVGFGLTGPPASAGDYAILAAAFVAMTIVDDLLFFPVVAASSRTRVSDRYRENLDIRLVGTAGRLAIALLAIAGMQVQPALWYVLPLLVLIGYLWHERWVRTREERQAWQNLAAATEKFTGVDLDEVLPAAVKGGARLFSADVLEVEVWLRGTRRLVRGDNEAVTFDGDPAGAPADAANVYAMPLHGYAGRRDIGALRLRFRGPVTMTDREQAMLSSYAASLDTAIRNAAAYGQLGEATAAHAHAAAHDPLTGLANRRELERLLTEALARDDSLDCRIAVLMIDLKHFKEVNDTMGHLVGDQVLIRLARRMQESVGARDAVARFGGDEFAVLLRDAYHSHRVRARAEQLLAALGEPVEVDGLPLVVEANAGLALALDPQDDPDRPAPAGGDSAGQNPEDDDSRGRRWATSAEWMAELMRRADVAMYQAKRASQPLVAYRLDSDPADRQRLALVGQLPTAVAQRQFVLHFQPIVDLATGRVRGAEALARWRHPTRGELAPRWFLDLLERSNQLQDFTAAVLDDALSAADMWRAAGHDLSVSVNISPRSLLDQGLPRMVRDALSAHHTEPARLCLELTETLAISQLDTVDQVLTQLQDIGVQLALDDFGTGYSSLAALSRIPVNQLKIDRSFVGTLRHAWLDDPVGAGELATPAPDVHSVSQARAVVRSTVQLGRTLDLTVVAEGIENQIQRELLWQMGCRFGQGHLFAAALPPDQFLARLTSGVADRPGHLAPPLAEDDKIVRLRESRRKGGSNA
jgi:diguanylate cyclase